MPKPISPQSTKKLRAAADEIEACGGGSEAASMRWAADEVDALRNLVRDNLPERVIRARLGFRQAEAILNPHLMEEADA